MQKISQEVCSKCKGRGWCGKSCPILNKIKEFLPKREMHFSGASPPEIFVGRYGYPNIYTGILSPNEKEETARFVDGLFQENEETYILADLGITSDWFNSGIITDFQ